MRKPALSICKKRRCMLAAVTVQLISAFDVCYIASTIPLKPLATFCGCRAWHLSDLVGNPKDRVSRDANQRYCLRPKYSDTQYCRFGNFCVTFILLIFDFLIIHEFLNSRASTKLTKMAI